MRDFKRSKFQEIEILRDKILTDRNFKRSKVQSNPEIKRSNHNG